MKYFTIKTVVGSVCLLWVSANIASAQTDKSSRTVTISNGDTVVNGKKMVELSRSERESVQKDFREMQQKLKETEVEIKGTGIIVERNNLASPGNRIIIRRPGAELSGPSIVYGDFEKEMPSAFRWSSGDSSKAMRSKINGNGFPQTFTWSNGDSSKNYTMRTNGKNFIVNGIRDSVLFGLNDSAMVKRFEFNFDSNMPMVHPPMARVEMPNPMRSRDRELRVIDGTPSITFGAGRNNTQSFVYSNTDKNGITSRMNIRISDTGNDELKKIAGTDKSNILDVEDLTLFPNFSTGKLTLSFNITSKATTEIKVLDSDINTVFQDKTVGFSGNYVKQLSIPKNGVYYISVSQSGKWFVKKIIKE